MRIAILFPNNIFTSPYLKYYINVLEKEKIAYDLIIWDREGVIEEGCIAFKSDIHKKSLFSKTYDFFRFRKFIIKTLKKNNYDRIIVFSGQLGILLCDFLVKNYQKQYLLDIRDYSTAMSYFKDRFKKVVENADKVCISSNGFKEWLPVNGNYFIGHNIDIELIEDSLKKHPLNKSYFSRDIINVDTIGQIKDFNSDKDFVDQLKNDSRFQMKFIGFGNALELLKEHTNKANILNVSFHGAYKKEEEKALLENTDVINILISRTEFNKGATLLSNRLYLAALLNIPCIVNDQTEQSKVIEKYKLGIVVDSYDELPIKLIKYKEEFDKKSFEQSCFLFLRDVKNDYELFESKITKFLMSN